MTDADHTQAADAPQLNARSFGAWLEARATWEKVALAVSILAVVGGGLWSLAGGDPPPPTPSPVGGEGEVAASFIGKDGQNPPGMQGASGEEPPAKGIFRLGFSFLSGFCIGAFLRATLKVAAIAFGFWLVMTFALAYVDIVKVDWHAMQGLWDRFAAAVEAEWGNFQSFILGSLPAAGLAVGGFALGMRRR